MSVKSTQGLMTAGIWPVCYQERETVCEETLEGCASGGFCEGGLQWGRPCRPPASAHVRPQRRVPLRDRQPGWRDQPEAEEGSARPLRLGEEQPTNSSHTSSFSFLFLVGISF